MPDFYPFRATLLPLALKNGHDGTAMLLMEQGAHIPTKYFWAQKHGNDNPSLKVPDVRLLHDAVVGGCLQSTNKLIDCGVDVNQRVVRERIAGIDSSNAFLFGGRERRYTDTRLPDVLRLSSAPSMVKLLLDAKALVNASGGEYAAIKDLVPASVKMLLEACPDLYCNSIIQAIEAPCSQDKVADKVEVVKMLLNQSMTRDVRRIYNWGSSLIVCAKAVDDPSAGQVARLLLGRDLGLYLQIDAPDIAVWIAAKHGNLDVFDVLSSDELRSRVCTRFTNDADDAKLQTLLSPRLIFCLHALASVVMGHGYPAERRKMLRMLYARGADFTVSNRINHTVMMAAVQLGQSGRDYLPDHATAIMIGDIAEYILARGR
jgi:hypothetical protein